MYTVDWTSHNIATWERTFSAAGWLRNKTPGLTVLEVSWHGALCRQLRGSHVVTRRCFRHAETAECKRPYDRFDLASGGLHVLLSACMR